MVGRFHPRICNNVYWCERASESRLLCVAAVRVCARLSAWILVRSRDGVRGLLSVIDCNFI